NVIGYDIINEPVGFFLVLTMAAASFELGGIDEIVKMLSVMSAQAPSSNMIQMVQELFSLLVALQIIPPDSSTATKEKWGFQDASLMGMLNVNYGFEKNYLQKLYEKAGAAIQAVDPQAVIWIEGSIGIDTVLGSSLGISFYESNMTRPAGLNHVVFEPHWYPDIYPTIGFNTGPRGFTPEEWRFRDFTPGIQGVIGKAKHSLDNIPVVLGEFGTEYNFNGWNSDGTLKAMAVNPADPKVDYPVSQEILDNYYENFEKMLLSHMQWCWSPEVTYARGEGWNNEDFSVIGPAPALQPRGEEAYSRPHPTFLSGKPVSTHFYSKLHYFDRDKGEVNQLGEYELSFKSKETNAPTEIFIPYNIYYSAGFYVWLTDGYAVYDHENTTLFYYPTADEPGHIHKIRIRPPLDGQENLGWQYFFQEDRVLSHGNPKDFE
ncbi:MAG: cellulase family glycosylhydrolase, partial [Proteobacteria bacterium]|nr:cellulase family glycosylhydrolase [Pseudomonadota bacterium]